MRFLIADVSPSPSLPGVSDTDLEAVAAKIASGDYAGLARDTGRTLVTDGRGGSDDEVVLAGRDVWRSAASGGGDDVLVGDAGDNWLVAGSGSNVMHGGAGADDFRFVGGHAGSPSEVVLDTDFDEGDRIVLTQYEDGTFSSGGRGTNVFSDGGAAIVTSMEGLARLAEASSDVTLNDGPDGLSLGIAQTGGLHENSAGLSLVPPTHAGKLSERPTV